jgi:hypothetical protein
MNRLKKQSIIGFQCVARRTLTNFDYHGVILDKKNEPPKYRSLIKNRVEFIPRPKLYCMIPGRSGLKVFGHFRKGMIVFGISK